MAAQQLHASFPKSFFPGFFPNTWQLPDLLSSAPVLKRLLLLLYKHTRSLREKGGRLHDFPFCSSPWLCPGSQGSFTFSSAILSLVPLLSPAHLLPLCLLSPGEGSLSHAAVLLQQCCCVCIPKGTLAEFQSIIVAPVPAGVSLLLCCTLRIWASTFSGCMLQLMWKVKMFIYPVE